MVVVVVVAVMAVVVVADTFAPSAKKSWIARAFIIKFQRRAVILCDGVRHHICPSTDHHHHETERARERQKKEKETLTENGKE